MKLRLIKDGKWNQYLAGAVSSLSFAACSAAYVWVNPVLRQLLGPQSPVPMDVLQSGLVGSLPELGCTLSPVLSGYLTDLLGRKTLLLWSAPVQIAAWMAIIFIRDAYLLFAVRFIQGLLLGAVCTVLPMYLAEIADSSSRGRLGVMSSLGWNFGILYLYSFGPFVSYYALIWVNIVLPAVFFIVFFWFNESPYYLVMKGRIREAEEALSSFRDIGYACGEEIESIRQSVAEERKEESSWKDLVLTRSGRKGLWILFVINVTFNMSGAMSVLAYCSGTFQQMTGQTLSSDLFTLGTGLVLTGVPFLTALTIDRFGRRPTLVISYAGSALCLLPAAVFFTLQERTSLDPTPWAWFPIVGLVLYPTMINFGAMIVAHTYQAELFPNSTRGLASALGTLFGSLTASFTLQIYLPMEKNNQDHITYILYTLFAVAGLIFSVVSAPETTGKTFDEIQCKLENKKYNHKKESRKDFKNEDKI